MLMALCAWSRHLTMAPAESAPCCPWLLEPGVAWYGSSHRDVGQYACRTLRSYIARNRTGAHVANSVLEEAPRVTLP